MTNISYSRRYARFGLALDTSDIPQADTRYAKLLLLDLLGCAVGALKTSEAEICARYTQATGNISGPASIWCTGTKTSADNAALTNGIIAHTLELDDFFGIDHSGAVIIPALVAACEQVGPEKVSGEDFLAAMIFGYEIGRRLLDCMGGYRAHNRSGWHTTGTLGAICAAAAVGRLLKLTEDQLVHAIGIGGSFTGGTWAFNADGAMTKRYHAGKAAETGLKAALLAREGFTGPEQIIEAEWGGYLTTYCGGNTPDESKLLDGLGDDLRIHWAGVKAYACCRGIHSSLDVILGMKREHGLTAEQIEKVEIVLTPGQLRQLGNCAPKARLEAQLSLPFSIAIALITGRADYDCFDEAWLSNPEVLVVLSKITLIEQTGLPDSYEPVVTVSLQDGEQLSGQVHKALGDPENPVPPEDIIAKYRGLAQRSISEDDTLELEGIVLSLEESQSIAKLCAFLRKQRVH
ncbi:MmgE/PrpD family protein [Pseudovibrio flavus]|uniref:MmgE/PrpD family protein n=1 Tax=Pseudovibrio flavus TaxID=2529854 RepID=UPI00211BEF94|nr:MmgE/PrpD family protein [Pseudovibrio flavus]